MNAQALRNVLQLVESGSLDRHEELLVDFESCAGDLRDSPESATWTGYGRLSDTAASFLRHERILWNNIFQVNSFTFHGK
ncbi:hypothetical protein D9M72_608340 [compost metagenome]